MSEYLYVFVRKQRGLPSHNLSHRLWRGISVSHTLHYKWRGVSHTAYHKWRGISHTAYHKWRGISVYRIQPSVVPSHLAVYRGYIARYGVIKDRYPRLYLMVTKVAEFTLPPVRPSSSRTFRTPSGRTLRWLWLALQCLSSSRSHTVVGNSCSSLFST